MRRGSGDYSPDGTRMVYSPQSRDFRPEKRYGGGQANRLYIYDLKTHATKSIAEGPRATRDPMWIGDTIYYDSDRDGHFNLYAYNTGNGKTTQVTHSKIWDVRWPSSDDQNRIVYEMNGELQMLDTRSGKAAAISITVPDDGLARRPSRVCRKQHRVVRAEPEGRARGVLSPRRHLQCTNRKRPDSEPDAFIRCARQMAELVA